MFNCNIRFLKVENLKRVRPTRFIGVPRVYEKIAEKMQEVGRSNKGIKKALGNWAKAAATEHNTLVREGKIKYDQGKLSYKLGMISNKMSLITIFGHKHFRQKFHQKFDIFHEKISTASDFGSYLVSNFKF